MKIFVTGAAGYIGATLIPMLLEKGHQVTALDNFMYNQSPLLEHCHNPNLSITRGDARDKDLVKKLAGGADVIIPLACYTGAPLCKKDPIGSTTTNKDAIINFLEFKSKDQMMIYPCTNSGYGIGDAGKECDEKSPLSPITLYGKLKVDAEKALLDEGSSVTFRFATVFGSSARARLDLLVNDFVYRAVNDRTVVLFEPHFKRNYLHIRDAAGAFIHTMENYSKMKGEPFNVGLSDANLNKEELCLAIKKQIPDFIYMIAPIGEDPDKRNYIISNAKIEKTGFRTKYSLDMGIKELIKSFEIIKRNEYSNI